MLLTSGERISMALVSMAINDLGHEADLVHRIAGRDRHRHEPRQGPHRRDAPRPRPRGARQRADRDRRRFPGRVDDARHHDARARRLRHDRGGARGRARTPRCARSTPTSTASTAPIRGSSRTRASSSRFRTRRCSTWRRAGARVLALRSVEYARNHGVKIHVRSSFNDTEGTWIVKEEDMEQAIISGIAHDTSEAKVTIRRVPDRPGVAGRTFRPLAEAGINIGEIVQNTSLDGLADISFTLPEDELDPRRADPGAALTRDRGRGLHLRARHRQGLGDRRRDEDEPGRRGRDLRGARRRGDQHRDHLDLVDPRLVRRARRASATAP